MRPQTLLLTTLLLLTPATTLAQTTPEADRLYTKGLTPHLHVQQANQTLQKALQQYKQANDRPGIHKTHLALAQLAYLDNNPLQLNLNLQPLQSPQTLQNREDQAQLNLLKGLQALEKEDYSSAQSHLLRASITTPGHTSIHQRARLAIAQINRHHSRYRTALNQTQTTLNFITTDLLLKADAQQTLADIHLDLGQYTEAISQYQQAINLRQILNNRVGQRNLKSLTVALTRLGRAQHALGQYSDAHTSYQTALQRIAPNDYQGTSPILNQLAQLALDNRQPDQAEKYLTIARDRFHTFGNNSQTHTEYLIIQGNYHRLVNQPDQAEKYYQQAIDRARATSDIPNQTRALTELGKLHLPKNPSKTITLLTTTIELYESIRPGLRDSEKISIADRQTLAYQLLQRALIQQNQPEQALLVAERSRARAMVELLAKRQGEPLGETTPLPTLESIRQVAKKERSTLISYSLLQDPDRPTIPNQSEQTLYIWVITPDGTITHRQLDLKTQNLSQIANQSRTAAQNGEILGPISATAQTIRQEIDRASIKIVRTQASTAPDNSGTQLRQGYDLLIKPIADLLPKNPDDRIIIIPQGSLFLVPFQALQNDRGQFLIENHTLSLSPSILTLSLTKPTGKTTAQPLIVGNPSPMPKGFAPLPGAEIEAKAIAQILNTQPLLGNQATKQAVLDRITQAPILHFATHGTLDDIQGLQSAITLVQSPLPKPEPPNPSLITAEELTGLKLNAHLAVLSACNTGRGKITGDGVVGLSRSFLSSGVSSVIVSLWEVPDQSTTALMTAFYTHLSTKPNKAQALRAAMLEGIKTSRSPNGWAGFMLIGSAD